MLKEICLFYDSADKKIGTKIGTELKIKGFNLSALGGLDSTQLSFTLNRAFSKCQLVLLVISRKSISSSSLVREIEETPNLQDKIIMLLVEKINLPTHLKHIKCIDFRFGYQRAISNLCNLLTLSFKYPSRGSADEKLETLGKLNFESKNWRKYSKLVGLIVLTTAIAISLLIECPSNIQLFSVYSLFGIALALILAEFSRPVQVKLSFPYGTVLLRGMIAIPFVLYFTDPVSKFKEDKCIERSPITRAVVTVYAKIGNDYQILQESGDVVMKISGEMRRQPVNRQGQTIFPNLLIGDTVKLSLEFTEPYKPLHPDSNYVIKGNDNIRLDVTLTGLHTIFGRVIYDDKPIKDVLVQLNTTTDSISATTNNNGYYTLHIPEHLQKKKQEVWFIKSGFKSQRASFFPQVNESLDVSMETSSHSTKGNSF